MSSGANFSVGSDSLHALGDALHAIADRGAGIGEVADEHAEHLLVRPGLPRERTERAPGDAAGGAVVGAVERRAGQRIDQRERGDAGGGEPASDLGVRVGIGVVFDQQIDLRGDRRIGIGDGTGRVAGIVEIKHVDRQRARRQLEAAPHLGAGEAEPFERHARRLVEIGERDAEASRLGPRGAEAAQASSPASSGRRRSTGRGAMRYWIASMLTKVPVRPTAFGTVIDRKNVARFDLRRGGRDQVGAHVLDDVDAVVGEQHLVHREGLGRCPRPGSPRPPRCRRRRRSTFCEASHVAADLLMPGSPPL